MKKVSVITWCNSEWNINYGQVLQAYAMQEIVKKLGAEVQLVRYRQKNSQDIIKYKLPFGILNELYENYCQKRFTKNGTSDTIYKFQKFMKKNANLTFPCYSVKDVERVTEKSQILICGSDQIWNPYGINKIFALNFGNNNQKRIAFAVSGIIPESKYTIGKYKEYSKDLENFNAISLREKSGIDILKKYTNKEIVDVLDPTFLLGTQDWDKVSKEYVVNEPYIFCYMIQGVRPYKRVIRELMKYYKVKKAVYIDVSNTNFSNDEEFIKVSNVGPDEFLSLLKNSKAVYTDSFHGMAFSINYEKQFCIPNIETNGIFHYKDRQKSLLQKCHINNRNCDCLKDIKNLQPIDYIIVKKHLEKERLLSWEFLKSAINKK